MAKESVAQAKGWTPGVPETWADRAAAPAPAVVWAPSAVGVRPDKPLAIPHFFLQGTTEMVRFTLLRWAGAPPAPDDDQTPPRAVSDEDRIAYKPEYEAFKTARR